MKCTWSSWSSAECSQAAHSYSSWY